MISKREVQHIAKLARIKLSESELKKFQKEISAILDYFNLLKEVDVSKTKPTFYPGLSIMREDKAEPQLTNIANKLVEAAPEKKNGYIRVKAVF